MTKLTKKWFLGPFELDFCQTFHFCVIFSCWLLQKKCPKCFQSLIQKKCPFPKLASKKCPCFQSLLQKKCLFPKLASKKVSMFPKMFPNEEMDTFFLSKLRKRTLFWSKLWKHFGHFFWSNQHEKMIQKCHFWPKSSSNGLKKHFLVSFVIFLIFQGPKIFWW